MYYAFDTQTRHKGLLQTLHRGYMKLRELKALSKNSSRKLQRILISFLFIAGSLLFAGKAEAATIRYIDNQATGANNGTSWTDAWTSFASALTGANALASSDEVIVYYKNRNYIEGTNWWALSGNFANMVTFRHDPTENNGVSTTTLTTSPGNIYGAWMMYINGTVNNITFEDIIFQSAQKTIDNAEVANWTDSPDITTSINSSIYQEGSRGINLTKDGTASVTASTSKAFGPIDFRAGKFVMYLYIKDAATLAKLATNSAVTIRIGTDSSNYYHWAKDSSYFTTGWNVIGNLSPSSVVGTPSLATTAYVYVGINSVSSATTWSDGDIVMDDLRAVYNNTILALADSGIGTNNLTVNNLKFLRCTFNVREQGGQAVTYNPSPVTTQNFSNITFQDSTFAGLATGNDGGILFRIDAGTPASSQNRIIANLQITGSTFTFRNQGVYITGVSNLLFSHNSVTATNDTGGSVPFSLGCQGAGGTCQILNSGIISDNRITTSYNHGLVIGGNTVDSRVYVLRNYVSSSLLTLIFHGAYNAVVDSNYLISRGGPAVLYKNGINNTFINNYIHGNLAIANDDGPTYSNSGNSIYNNFILSSTTYNWTPENDGGGNIFNNNFFDVTTSNTPTVAYGTINVSSYGSLAALQSGWNSWVGHLANDSNSLFGGDGTYSSPGHLSPLIDTGTTTGLTSTTTDYLGNPIYGTPDIGAYEYQPPFALGTSSVDPTGSIRIYGDRKYRYTTATSSTRSADFSVAPAEGSWAYSASTTRPEWLNISDMTWGTTKQWTASSSSATTTVYTVGDLTPNAAYTITVDGTASSSLTSSCSNDICTSSSDGKLVLTYTGGYSTHTFAVTPYTAPTPTPTPTVSSGSSSSSGSSGSSGYYIRPLVSPTPIQTMTATTTCSVIMYPLITKNIQEGSMGTDVLLLKKILGLEGLLTSTTVIYGASTTKAVSIFQSKYSIVSSGTPETTGYGNVGPKTRALINKMLSDGKYPSLKQCLGDSSTGNMAVPNLSNASSTNIVSKATNAYSFVRNLALGSTGSDVKALQVFLNANGFTISDTGAGSLGYETNYFGPATKAALIKFQNTHADTILKPQGLTEGTGFFGEGTRKYVGDNY